MDSYWYFIKISTEIQQDFQCHTYNATFATYAMPITHTMPFVQPTLAIEADNAIYAIHAMPIMNTMPFLQFIQFQLCVQCHLCNTHNAHSDCNAITATLMLSKQTMPFM